MAKLTGSANNDIFLGDTNPDDLKDFIYGNAGNDVFAGILGDDYLDGGDGNDFIEGDTGNDTILGGNGNDMLGQIAVLNSSSPNTAFSFSESGNDTIDGGSGSDLIGGGEGNDRLEGGTEGDILGAFTYQFTTTAITTYTCTEAGNDRISGGADTDLLSGGDGNDQLVGGTGNDTLGEYTFVAAGVTATGNATSTIQGFDSGNDRLDGGEGGDYLCGGSGNDQLVGGTGDDILGDLNHNLLQTSQISGSMRFTSAAVTGADLGNDRLDGGAGNDSLNGGAGNDVLMGCAQGKTSGKGEIDRLAGGAGGDRFVLGTAKGVCYSDGKSRQPGQADYAIVTDFNSSEGDRLQLAGRTSQYKLGNSPIAGISGKAIFCTLPGATSELVAIIQGSGISLGKGAVFVG
ncbi:hypothetical protein IFO70_17720 [Phormidium tenue FACHB-886]|nr:hypothetical protein [Phormidium tenue FACHB-886]